MNCRRATSLLSESQERKLGPVERAGLKLHVTICAGCRNFGRQVKILRRISRAYAGGAAEKVAQTEEEKENKKS